MLRRVIEDRLRGIEAQTIEAEFADPVAGIGDEVFAHRTAVFAIEVNRITPLVIVLFGNSRK